MEESMEERVCVQKKRSGSIYLYMDFPFVYIIWHGAHTGISRCFWGVEELTFAYYISFFFWHLIMVSRSPSFVLRSIEVFSVDRSTILGRLQGNFIRTGTVDRTSLMLIREDDARAITFLSGT
ncbi:hypothetical protein GE21DRAFT_1085546 [Neurospora crassa]|nr:hypothetical protein GE21DRAFT_1085546 [Neurospora crassa]